MDENTKINEMNITDEFFKVGTGAKGNVVAQNLRKLGEGGVVLVINDDDEVIGYITEKEVIESVALGNDPKEVDASEIMNTDFMEVLDDDTLGNLIPKISDRYPNAIVVINVELKCMGFFSKNDYREALAALGSYDKSHDPANPDEWRTKGIALSTLGKPDEALKCYEKSLEAQADKERAWLKLAKRLEGKCRFKDALMCYDRVLTINLKNDEAWVNKGNVYSTQKTHNLAMLSYNLALTVDPENSDAMINMGLELCDVGEVDQAVIYFDKAEAIKGESAELCFRKGNAYEKGEKYMEALSCYNKATTLDEKYEDAWFNKSAMHHKLGDDNQARECLEKILLINPDNKNAHQTLARAEKTGKLDLMESYSI